MIELEIDKCVHSVTFRCLRTIQAQVIWPKDYVDEDWNIVKVKIYVLLFHHTIVHNHVSSCSLPSPRRRISYPICTNTNTDCTVQYKPNLMHDPNLDSFSSCDIQYFNIPSSSYHES